MSLIQTNGILTPVNLTENLTMEQYAQQICAEKYNITQPENGVETFLEMLLDTEDYILIEDLLYEDKYNFDTNPLTSVKIFNDNSIHYSLVYDGDNEKENPNQIIKQAVLSEIQKNQQKTIEPNVLINLGFFEEHAGIFLKRVNNEIMIAVNFNTNLIVISTNGVPNLIIENIFTLKCLKSLVYAITGLE